MSTMLRISEAASLAMHAMLLLAKAPETILSTHEAATKLGVSEAHLAKVMQRLQFVEQTQRQTGNQVRMDGLVIAGFRQSNYSP